MRPAPTAPEAPGGTDLQRDAAVRFRERHVRLGVLLCAVGIALVAGYAGFGHPVADPALVLLVCAVAAVVTAAAWAVGPRAVRHRHHGLFFFVWSAAMCGLVLTTASIDGGGESPTNSLLFMLIVYAALAYPSHLVLALGALEVLGYGAVGVASAARAPNVAIMAASLGFAAFTATRVARTREQQDHELQTLTRRLEVQATSDELTGCLNRRGFDAALETELSRAIRYDRPLSLLLIDVDNLKVINDERGHGDGDEALQLVGNVLRQAGRQHDIAARLGGDEFALLVPETPLAGALERAERIHRLLRTAAGDSPVTVSVGAAAAAGAGSVSARELLHAADTALYSAKREGRNRTACAENDPANRPTLRAGGRSGEEGSVERGNGGDGPLRVP